MVTEEDARHVREYTRMIQVYARMAVECPDTIGPLREALGLSAALMMSNRPEAVVQFRELSKEVDAFLQACQTGEVDARAFLESLDSDV